MTILDHWHPVHLAADLRHKPVAARLAGRDLVLYRDSDGQAAALDDCCPHRRMRLSLGKVCDGRLRCAYHGWSFDAEGNGESPGAPKLHATLSSYDVAESHGLIWVRARGSDLPMPEIDPAGGVWGGVVGHQVRAPLELLLDNFTEIEHTALVHATFGFPLDRLAEVTCCVESTETEVHTVTEGPCKDPGFLLRLLMGIGKDFHFHSDWVTRFSPVHTVVDHFWDQPGSEREAMIRWRFLHFFVPADEHTSQIFTMAYVTARYPLPSGGVPLFRWFMLRKMTEEVDQDKFILENLADQDISIEGLKLSRFDRPLGLNRERLARVYRGLTQTPSLPRYTLQVAG